MGSQLTLTPPDTKDADWSARILEAARCCIARRGFERTTIADICRQAGIPKRTLYRYFPNRDSIINAAVASDTDRSAKALRVLLDTVSDTGEDPIMALQERMLGLLAAPERFDVWRQNVEWWAAATRNPQILAGFQATWRGWQDAVAPLVRSSLGGEPRFPANLVSMYLLALFNGLLLHTALNREALDFAELQRFARYTWEHLRRAMRAGDSGG